MTSQSQLTAQSPMIVVVDDDPAVRNSLKFSLELEGFAVRAYRSAAELLSAGEPGDCRCYVIDQRMPDMNGIDLIGKLRERRIATPAILVISQPNELLSARAAKARVPIVEKPFLNNLLVDKIREACQRA
ncbi:MAG TPA: response regulator [Xanthobacteraceae bacterium]|nr:response regulator [Xanthobacteraceae bacterium]